MMMEPNYSVNTLKWRANRNLGDKEGYQKYDIDFKKKTLIPVKDSKLDMKRKVIDDIIAKNVSGKTVIDLGCDKGYFCWVAIKSGAKHVVANEINEKLYTYLQILKDFMKWENFTPLQIDLFVGSELVYDYVLALAMIHQVKSLRLDQIVQRIRTMTVDGALIEFCEDYRSLLGPSWNRTEFEKIISGEFSSHELVGEYHVAKGPRLIYDCRCH